MMVSRACAPGPSPSSLFGARPRPHVVPGRRPVRSGSLGTVVQTAKHAPPCLRLRMTSCNRRLRWACWPMRILFVENHPVFAKTVVAEFLSAHEVACVPSVREAVRQLEAGAFDAVLVDYDLDDGKGDEVVRIARSRHPSARIVACSARPEGNDELIRAGAHAVCAKGSFARIDTTLRSVDAEPPSAATLEPKRRTDETARARADDVCSAISTERWVGCLVCVFRDLRPEDRAPEIDEVTALLDRFVGELGLVGLGENWLALSRALRRLWSCIACSRRTSRTAARSSMTREHETSPNSSSRSSKPTPSSTRTARWASAARRGTRSRRRRSIRGSSA